MAIDKKLLETSCRTFLKEVAMLSDKFEKITDDDWRRLEGFINKLTTEEMFNILFEGKLQEGDFWKYAQAGVAGAAVAGAIKKRKFLGPKTFGALGGIAAYYLYKRFTDKCRGFNTSQEQASCRATAAQRVLKQLRSNLKDCEQSAIPEKCSQKLHAQIDKWQRIYSDQAVKAVGAGKK